MHNINLFLFELVHQGAGYYPVLDRVLVAVTTYITDATIAAVLLYLFVVPFRAGGSRERWRRFGQAAETALSLALTYALVQALKLLVAHPRPFVALADTVMPLVSAAPLQSFPSMHAALTMALAIAVLPYRKHLGHALIAFSLIVGLSRLYVGVHYPLDVGVGFAIGFLIPKLIHRGLKSSVVAQTGKKA